MTSVIAWIRRFGNTGAVANARVLADQRAAEEWNIAAMARRLEDHAPAGNPVGYGAPISDRPASAA